MRVIHGILRPIAFVILAAAASALPAPETAPAGPVIQVHVKRFSFTPSEITVTKGVPTTVVVTSEDVTHGLTLPELGLTETFPKGNPVSFTITAKQAGDFQGRCNHFCGVGHGSMTFTVHVKDS